MKTLEETPNEMAKKLIDNFSDVKNIAYEVLKPLIKFVVIKSNIFKAIDLILSIHPIPSIENDRELAFIKFWEETKIEVGEIIQASISNYTKLNSK